MSAATVFQYLAASDRRLCFRLSGWTPPRPLLRWMLWSARLGDGWLWVVTAALLVLGGPSRWPTLAATSLSAAAANMLVVALKGKVRRPRPAERPPNCLFSVMAERWSFDEYSFPSGHALNAFALATTVGLAAPTLAPLLFLLAVSIAASRLVLGVHFLTDVVAGAIIGAVAGLAAFAVVLG